MFLALDTVFDQCSVALVTSDFEVLSYDTQTGKRMQTQQILPMIQRALAEANLTLNQLQGLIFNRGPGAFSGIRINTAVVQALSVAHDLPCVGVSSLASLAQSAFEQHGVSHVYAALDARMKQVYFGEYELSQISLTNFPNLVRADKKEMNQPDFTLQKLNTIKIMTDVTANINQDDNTVNERLLDYEATTEKTLALVGNGAPLLTAKPKQLIISDIHPNALTVAKLGIAQYLQTGGMTAEQALPVYLRNNAWKTLKEQGRSV